MPRNESVTQVTRRGGKRDRRHRKPHRWRAYCGGRHRMREFSVRHAPQFPHGGITNIAGPLLFRDSSWDGKSSSAADQVVAETPSMSGNGPTGSAEAVATPT